jgi:hypothetical protein
VLTTISAPRFAASVVGTSLTVMTPDAALMLIVSLPGCR